MRSKSLIQFSLICLLSRRPGFDSRQVHARFLMDKLVLGEKFVSKYFSFPLLIFHESCILSSSACCSYQDKVRSLRPPPTPPPPKKAMVFGKLGIIWCKILSLRLSRFKLYLFARSVIDFVVFPSLFQE